MIRAKAALALALLLPAAAVRAEDALARCDRGADLLRDRGSYGQRTLEREGVFVDESREFVQGSAYRAHYVYFLSDAQPAEVVAAFLAGGRAGERGGGRLKVSFEDAVPYIFVPKPRYTLASTLASLPGGGWRLDMTLDSFADNSSHPAWFDAFLRVEPYQGKTLGLYCKYVVPADKRMPSVANSWTRERAVALARSLRQASPAQGADGARERLDALFSR